MLSGREEPEQQDLQLVPKLRPQSLRGYPALGAVGTKDADWSEIASGSDSESDAALGALSSSAPAQHVQKKMKKRVVVCGNPPHSEAECQYMHRSKRDVD